MVRQLECSDQPALVELASAVALRCRQNHDFLALLLRESSVFLRFTSRWYQRNVPPKPPLNGVYTGDELHRQLSPNPPTWRGQWLPFDAVRLVALHDAVCANEQSPISGCPSFLERLVNNDSRDAGHRHAALVEVEKEIEHPRPKALPGLIQSLQTALETVEREMAAAAHARLPTRGYLAKSAVPSLHGVPPNLASKGEQAAMSKGGQGEEVEQRLGGGQETTASAEQRRPGRWFDRATRGMLNVETLRMAATRGRLVRSIKIGSRWHHSVEEVVRLYPEYGERILRHVD